MNKIILIIITALVTGATGMLVGVHQANDCNSAKQQWRDWYDARDKASSKILEPLFNMTYEPNAEAIKRNVDMVYTVLEQLDDNWRKTPHP